MSKESGDWSFWEWAGFVSLMVVLFLLFGGDPDLIDAVRDWLIRLVKQA